MGFGMKRFSFSKKLAIKIRGFTLIELLVVISIIALLLSVLMPSLQKARKQAQKIVCTSTLKNLGLATYLYIEDNEDYFPAVEKGWSFSWYGVLAPYVSANKEDLGPNLGKGGKNVFVCPSSKHPNRSDYMDYVAAQGRYLDTSYGIIGIDYSVPTKKKPTNSRKITDIIKSPSSVIWLVEGENRSGIAGAVMSDAFIWKINYSLWPLQFGNRHEGDNAVFVDWHVEFRSNKKGFEYKDFEIK